MTSTYYFCLVLATLTHWTYSTNYNYIVHTYTTDSYYAGTDAPVYIKFYDGTGKLLMGERELHSDSRNPFSKGSHDKSLISLGTHLGKISYIQIKRGSTTTGLFDDWFVDKVVVEDPINNAVYVFNCGCKLTEANKWRKVTGTLNCKSGYFLSNGKCDDVECKNAGICKDTNAVCTKTSGSAHCRNCKNGYYYNEGKCQDIDECQNGTSNCEQKCQNSNGGYSCECYNGFQLKNQFQCIDVDECKNPQQCDSHATCVNKPGTFACYCFSGYEKQNGKCINIDECTRSKPCDWKTSVGCTDTDGGYRCHCKQGYYNEKDYSCKDINECQGQNTCDPKSSVCDNLEGTYRCNCLPGFIMSSDGKRCIPRTCTPLIIPNGGVVFPSRCTKQDSNSYNDVCRISCTAGYRISDPSHSTLTCGQQGSWVGTVPTCTPVSCKSLISPTNGRIIPSLCSVGGKYTQKCSFLCNDGYVRNGADEAVCQQDGRWSTITPTCEKVTSDAWIRCPPGVSAVLKPGENTADISSMWKLPQTSSNVKYISSSHNKKNKFQVGITFVTWTVSSDNLRKKNCSFAVSVYDKEKPVAVDCPKQPLAILTTKDKEVVHLAKVRFTDNVEIKSVEYSRSNPVILSRGTHSVTVSGKDTSNNIGYCMYQVIVKAKECSVLDDPLGGVKKCNHFMGTSYCAITCRGDKVVFNATGNWGARTWFCLAGNPIWMPTPKVPDCVDYAIYNGSSCPAGKVLVKTTLPSSASSPVHVCGACPSGNFYENGQCKECPVGTYLDTTGNNGVTSCKKCGPNTSSKPGSTKKVDCRATCTPGYYSADGFNPCELCKRGEYQPKYASKSCNKCPQDRTCTRHEGALAIESCGPCPVITRVVPSGKVQRLLGGTFKVTCYMNATGLARQMKWRINLDDSGQQVSGVYMKKLYDSNSKQIGEELRVRGLTVHHSGTYECVAENQFGDDRKSVHLSVVQDSHGSGFGRLNDDE